MVNFNNYMKDEWKAFKHSLRLDKVFGKVLLWEVLLMVAVFIGLSMWSMGMDALAPLIEQAATPFSGQLNIASSMTLHNTEAIMEGVKNRMVTYTVLIVLYLILVWSLFKSLSYTALLKKRLTKHLYLKFIAANIIWALILFIVTFAFQVAFYQALFRHLPYSGAARATVLFGSIFLLIALSYFTIMFFIIFTRKESIKKAFISFWQTALKRIHLFLVPMLFALVMFGVLNIVIRLLSFIPKSMAFIITTPIVLAFLVWLKVYYNDCTDRIAPEKAKAPKTVRKTVKRTRHKASPKKK